jgi:MFS family permease
MATQVRHPIWLPAAGVADGKTFAILYSVESLARATVASVIPIQAYALLASEQAVSVLYTLVGIAGLIGTIAMPLAIERFARRWVYTAGALFLAGGSALMITDTIMGQAAGMFLRIIGAGALSITLNLYIMDHIRRHEYIRTESLRLAVSTLAWLAGPTLGVFLYQRYGLMVAHGSVAVFAGVLCACFWWFRLSDNKAIQPGTIKPQSPLRNIRRFIGQPRLRLAWLIAFGRSCFWTTFFVYGPILMVAGGEGALAGGLLVSVGNGLLFTAIYWGRLGERFGARRVMALAFAAMAVTQLAAAITGEALPWVTGGLLLVCAFFAISLDALGSSAFLRAVHPFERARMTAVYRTYLDLSDLLPPLVYSIVLVFFGIGAVFASLSVFTAICGVITYRYLPRRF